MSDLKTNNAIHRFLLEDIKPLETSAPEEQGIPSASVIHFLEEIKKNDLEVDSLQVVRNGKLCVNMIAKPYHENSFHRIYSAAKGIVATAILFAVQEERLSLDSKVIDLLPAVWIPEDLDERWTRLTVYHLLTMTTGHDRDTMFEMWKRDCWIRTFFEVKPAYEPGTYFLYDMGAQYVMNEIIHHLTGQTTGEYLEERLFRKIGVEYTNCFTSPEGLFFSSTMQLKPEGITRLAYFYLNKGKWNGEQLLREDLAVLAGAHHGPSSHVIKGRNQGNFAGYALHMWRNKAGGFRFDGGQGQFGLVLPEENMAVGMLCCTNDASKVLDIFFDTIFAESFNHPIEKDPYDSARLEKMISEYSLLPFKCLPHADIEGEISGKTYVLEENPWGQRNIAFFFRKDNVLIKTEDKTGAHEVLCGLNGAFPETDGGYILTDKRPEDIADIDHNFGYEENRTMYSGGFTGPDVFSFIMRSHSFLSDHRFECEFTGDFVEIRMSNNTVNPRGMYRNRAEAPEIILRGRR